MINTYTALDIETTGLNPADDKIIEIGMVRVVNGEVEARYSQLINPEVPLSAKIQELTGIKDSMLQSMPVISDIITDVLEFTGDFPILGHNVIFDYSFIKKAAVNKKLNFEKNGIDTLKIARRILPEVEHRNLGFLCTYFQINPGNSHRALDDALSAKSLYERMYSVNPQDSGFSEAVKLVYNVKRDSAITPAQISYLSALIKKHNIAFADQIDKLTKRSASRYIDGIISEFGK